MQLYKKLFITFTILLFLPLSAHSECCKVCFDPCRTYDLNSLTDLALSLNPSTKVIWAQIKAACANIGIQQAAYFPTITGNLVINDSSRGGFGAGNINGLNANNNNNNNSTTTDPNVTNNSNGVSQGGGGGRGKDVLTYGAYISINYLVFDFGTRRNNLKASIFQWLVTRFNGDETIQQIVQSVEQNYYLTLGYSALIVANQKSVDEARFNLSVTQGLHKQGLAVIGDVYQAESALAQAQLVLEQAEGNYMLYRGQLNAAVGLPVSICLKIKPLASELETTNIIKCIDRLLALAEHKRPDLIAARNNVCANCSLLKAAIAQLYPKAQLTANAGYLFPEDVPGGGPFHNATLNISFPIVNQTLKYQIKQARANLELSMAQAKVLADQVDLQVWQAYYALKTAGQSVTTTQVLLKSSTVAAKQAAGQYRAGVGTVLNMLTTQATLESARAQYIQARMNWYISLSQLYLALGTLVRTPCS